MHGSEPSLEVTRRARQPERAGDGLVLQAGSPPGRWSLPSPRSGDLCRVTGSERVVCLTRGGSSRTPSSKQTL